MGFRFSFRKQVFVSFVLIYTGLSISYIGFIFSRNAQGLSPSPFGSESPDNKSEGGTDNQSTVVYSAFIDTVETNGIEKNDSSSYRTKLVIIAWQTSNVINKTFKCCILESGQTLVSSQAIKSTQCCYNMGKVRARRVECPIYGTYLNIQGVSMAEENKNCPNNLTEYVKPTVLSSDLKQDKWAICIKYIYGRGPNSRKLVEWFEIHRSLGVDKFLIHFESTIHLSTKTVLQFYQMEGLADVVEINAPFKDTINRHNHSPRSELFNDEQVGLWNCRERLKYYNFVGDLDTDEFILSHDITKYPTKKTLADVFRRNPVGVVTFYTYVHIISWEKTNKTSSLLIGQYEEASEPLIEAPKNMYMPSRIRYGEGTVHSVYPKTGFSRIFVDPTEAAIHHFRLCRRHWLNPFTAKVYRNGTLQYLNMTCDFRRERFAALHQLNVSKLDKQIHQVFTNLRI